MPDLSLGIPPGPGAGKLRGLDYLAGNTNPGPGGSGPNPWPGLCGIQTGLPGSGHNPVPGPGTKNQVFGKGIDQWREQIAGRYWRGWKTPSSG